MFTKIQENSEMLIEILKSFIGVLLSVLTLWVPYQLYKYPIKRKNKLIQLTNKKTEILKSILILILFYPILIISFHNLIAIIMGLNVSFFINIISTIVIYIFLCALYIHNSIKIDSDEGINFRGDNKWNKIKYILKNFIAPIILFFIYTLLSLCVVLFLLGLIVSITSSTKDEMKSYIYWSLGAYLVNLIVAWFIYVMEKLKLQRFVKEVRVFYMQNSVPKEGKGIKYNNFYISKEFLRFYSDTTKRNIVFPIKNLLRIEYYYYD